MRRDSESAFMNRPLLNRLNFGSNSIEKSHSESPELSVTRGSMFKKRALFKNGNCNVVLKHSAKQTYRYLQDFFTTLVDCQWRWTLLVFAFAFFGSWLLFAFIWWLIALTHGDLQEDHLPENQNGSNWIPCVTNIDGFTSAFLFSVETQHTTGYGLKYTTNECPDAIFLMCLQSIIGLIIQDFMVGLVFAKMTRPKLRSQTLQFSKKAVISYRDRQLCLTFRLGDMRKTFIICPKVRAYVIHTKHTAEGECLNHFQKTLSVDAEGCDGDLFFIWPLTIIHRIDKNSPFYHLSASDLLKERFEIIVVLEGTIENTGQSIQARSSYVPSEIMWGHRFEDVVVYDKANQIYVVDHSKFNTISPINTPLCSAADLDAFFMQYQNDELLMLKTADEDLENNDVNV